MKAQCASVLRVKGAANIDLKKLRIKIMAEEVQEKDKSILYIALFASIFVGVLLMVKSSEADKFAPIKEQVKEELRLMNIRVLNE